MMTLTKTVLDLIIDANLLFALAFTVWFLAHFIIKRTVLRTDYALQLRLLRTVLLFVILSPAFSLVFVSLSQSIWPKMPLTASDIAVAAYLRGDLGIPALQFEHLLTLRSRFLDQVMSQELVWVAWVFIVLAIGSLIAIIQTLLAVFHVRSIISRSYLWRRTNSTDIRLSDTVEIPFAARGLWRRHIVLPSRLLVQPTELRIVLAHEFEHLRQGDAEWELIFEFMRPVLYWNPVYLLWKRAFALLRELNCDRAVLATLKITPRDYARCILDFCRTQSAPKSAERLNVAFVRTGAREARHLLQTRLLALNVPREVRPSGKMFFGLAVSIASLILVASVSIHSPRDWSQDRLMLSTIVNLERLEAINRGF